MTALQGLRGLVVIDEAQRQPGIFPVLRVLADLTGDLATFLILGSATPELSRQAFESLAGQVEIIEMCGFDLGEMPDDAQEMLWHRGGFPRAYLAGDEESSVVWRKNFIRTFLERDLGAFGFGLARAHGSLLDDARPLPRTDLEWQRDRRFAGYRTQHRPRLS